MSTWQSAYATLAGVSATLCGLLFVALSAESKNKDMGKYDPAFIPTGAEAYRKDLPHAEVHFLDTGHFVLETHAQEVADHMEEFLSRKLKA